MPSPCPPLLLALAACGGGGGDEEGFNAEPAPTTSAAALVTVSVTLADSLSADVLFNRDSRTCTTASFADLFNARMENPEASADELAAMVPKVSITLTDASGTIVATEELSQVGGAFTEGSGCRRTEVLTGVPASDFYTVTVKRDTFEKSQQVAREGAAQVSVTVGL